MCRQIAVCYMTMSAKKEARGLAILLQQENPDDEVVLFDRVHPSPWPVPEELRPCDVRIYVDCERRQMGGGKDWY